MELNWAAAFEVLRHQRISDIYQQPEITHDQFVSDLELLAEIFDDKYLAGSSGPRHVRDGVRDLCGPQQELVGFHCKFLHVTAHVIRQCQHIPGFERLKKQLQSDRGFYNQLLATWYWSNVLPVLGIEQNIDGHDIDILSELDGRTLKIHVKTLDQWEKGNLVFTATAHIWQVLGKHICQNTGKPLGIAAFDGVVPPGLEVSDWERLLENVPREPGIHSIAVDEKHSVVLELAYTTEGKIRGPNEMWNYQHHRAAIACKIPPDDTALNVYLGVVSSDAKSRELGNPPYLVDSPIDLEIFVEPHPAASCDSYYFIRSRPFCTRGLDALAAKLSEALPVELRLPVPFAYNAI